MKGLFFRLKGQPIASAVATLVGGDLFTFAGKWPWQWEPTPLFRLCTAASPRCARQSAAVGQAQECSSQTVSGSFAKPFGRRRRSCRLLWAYFESPGGPAHGSSSRRPTRARTSMRRLQSTSRAAHAHGRPSARVGAVFEHGYAQCGYWSDVCHVCYCMYRQYLSSCVSWP